MSEDKRQNLLVVDDQSHNISIVRNIMGDKYRLLVALNGEAALDIFHREQIDAVLLDIVMPGMDGFEVCKRIKSDPRNKEVPVIFVSSLEAEEDINRGMELGAYFFINKPIEPQQLRAVVRAAIEQRELHKQAMTDGELARRMLSQLDVIECKFQEPQTARDLASMVALMAPGCNGALLALTELMVNAVEHGNLGITYDEKSKLNEQFRLAQEISMRLQMPEYAGRYASIRATRDENRITVEIQDDGNGFDWQQYLTIDPSRLFDNHGRGIALANMGQDVKINYIGDGSRVELQLLLNL